MTSMKSLEKPALISFFQQYEDEDFQYDVTMPATQQLKQLSQNMTSQEVKAARNKFGRALAKQFTQTFGDELDSLESWQALCRAVSIDPVPDTLEEAQVVSNISPFGLSASDQTCTPSSSWTRLSNERMSTS